MISDDSDISSMFDMLSLEHKKLELQLDGTMLDNSKLPISQIIPIYHQVLNVSSLIQIFKQSFEHSEPQNESQNLINNVESLISKTFNSNFHPKFLEQLSVLVSSYIDKLKSQKNSQKTETEIKNDAAIYDKLRELMSTKEFVEQYDKGLIHD